LNGEIFVHGSLRSCWVDSEFKKLAFETIVLLKRENVGRKKDFLRFEQDVHPDHIS